MLKNFFNFKSSERFGYLKNTFYNVELKQQFGKYPIGTKFEYIHVDFYEGTIEMFNENDTWLGIVKFNLNIIEE